MHDIRKAFYSQLQITQCRDVERSAQSRLHRPGHRCGIQPGGFQQGRQAQPAGSPGNRLVGRRRLVKCHSRQGQWRPWVAPTFKPCAEVVNWRSSQETL